MFYSRSRTSSPHFAAPEPKGSVFIRIDDPPSGFNGEAIVSTGTQILPLKESGLKPTEDILPVRHAV